MKKQYLTTVEFRYYDAPKYSEDDSAQHLNKIITLGVFDTIEDANTSGNAFLEVLETKFKLNPNYNVKQRLGGRYAKNLISDLGYIQTPFTFYLKITELKYQDVEQSITDVTEAIKRYRQFKSAAEKNS